MKQTIIITGATGKFGKVLVKNFLKKGDTVIAIGKSKKKLNQLKIYLEKKNQNLFLYLLLSIRREEILIDQLLILRLYFQELI